VIRAVVGCDLQRRHRLGVIDWRERKALRHTVIATSWLTPVMMKHDALEQNRREIEERRRRPSAV